MEHEDFKKDELINIKLPRRRYELLNKMIEREETYSWVKNTLSTSWIWIVAGGTLTVIALWDRVATFVHTRI